MRCHSVEALLCKAHRNICQGLLEAWKNEFFFNCLWGSILEYWDYFEMKSKKTLWAWNICSIFVGNWNHVIRLTTFVRRYVMYKHQITERYQCNCCLGQVTGYGITIISGQKTRYENSKYDFFICRGCCLDYWAIPCGLCQQETNFSFVTVSQLTPVTLHEG